MIKYAINGEQDYKELVKKLMFKNGNQNNAKKI